MTDARATGASPDPNDPIDANNSIDTLDALHTLHTLDALVELLDGRSFVALVGAGCSTESGIPDYRGPGSRRTPVRPIMFQEFVRSADTRARYWARSAVGWRRVADARPNPAHVALATLEAPGPLAGVITQNVDGLHARAGSRRVVELHGSLATVRCLGCGGEESRDSVQERMLALNPAWAEHVRALESARDVSAETPGAASSAGAATPGAAPASNPDGDVDLADELTHGFRVPDCEACGGVLKPDVVFFGENVPAAVVEAAWDLYAEGEALLVLGSSLTVYSGRRFVDRAARDGRPVAVVNLGPTRADDRAAVRLEGRVGDVLPRLARRLATVAAMALFALPTPAVGSGQAIHDIEESRRLQGEGMEAYRGGEARTATVVRAATTLLGSDDLLSFGDDLFVVQNGIAPNRVLKLTPSRDGHRIAAFEVLLAPHPDFAEPTGAVMVNGKLYLVANSHWPHFAGGEVSRPEELRDPIILEVEP
jgi:NAD-dependent SIR2 family protein deacetylase